MQRLLNAVRLTEFMSMLTLKRYQRLLVSHFRRYQVEEISTQKDKNKVIDPTEFVKTRIQDEDAEEKLVTTKRRAGGLYVTLNNEQIRLLDEI